MKNKITVLILSLFSFLVFTEGVVSSRGNYGWRHDKNSYGEYCGNWRRCQGGCRGWGQSASSYCGNDCGWQCCQYGLIDKQNTITEEVLDTSSNNIVEKPIIEKTAETVKDTDILVIGSGPAGLSAALHTARAGFKSFLIEGENPGGQLMETTYVENFPACPKTLGSILIKKMREQTKSFGVNFISDTVSRVDFSSYPYKVYTRKGKIFATKVLIIDTRVSSLGVKGENEYFYKGVNYSLIIDTTFCKGKDVIVVGGGDTAVEYACQLSQYAKKVTILVRGSKMRAIKSSQDNLKKLKNISILYNTSVKEIIGDGRTVTEILINDFNGATSKIKVSLVFVAVSNEPNTQFLGGTLNLDKDGDIVLNGTTQATSLLGVFASGDVSTEKIPLAVITSATGTQAGHEAVRFLLDF